MQQDFSGNPVSGIGPWDLTQPPDLELFDLSVSSPSQQNFSPASSLLDPDAEMDSAVQDSTGATVATEEFTGNLLLTDLSQRTGTAGSPGSWNSPSSVQNLPELGPVNMSQFWLPTGPAPSFFTSGATAISIATGTHYGFIEDEFGSGAIGAFVLPSSSTAGSAPQVLDYVLAALPNDPVTQAPWENSFDPHGLAAAYATIGSGNAYGILMNTTYNVTTALSEASPSGTSSLPYSRTSIAVVSLPGLIAAPRVSGCTQNTVPIASITESGSTVTVTTASPHGFSPGQVVTIGDLFDGWVVDPLGSLGYNGTFTITSVPDAGTTDVTFTYTAPVTGLGDAINGTGLFAGADATSSVCTPDFSGHFVDPSYDLVANGVVRFFSVH